MSCQSCGTIAISPNDRVPHVILLWTHGCKHTMFVTVATFLAIEMTPFFSTRGGFRCCQCGSLVVVSISDGLLVWWHPGLESAILPRSLRASRGLRPVVWWSGYGACCCAVTVGSGCRNPHSDRTPGWLAAEVQPLVVQDHRLWLLWHCSHACILVRAKPLALFRISYLL